MSSTTTKENEKIEFGLRKDLYLANATRRRQDKLSELKDFLREQGEDPKDYSPRYLRRLLASGFMD